MINLRPNSRFRVSLIRGSICGFFLLASLTSQSIAQTSSQAETHNQNANRWHLRLTSLFRRKPPLPQSPGGSRGKFCLLSPGLTFDQGKTEFWNQRPSFIWTGSLGKIRIQEKGASEPLWQQVIHTNSSAIEPLKLQVIRYEGPALELGKQYQWQAFGSASDSSPHQFRNFVILPSDQQGPVTRAWLREEVALKQDQATIEKQTQRQLEFLLDQDLSADFYQSMLLAAFRGHLNPEVMEVVLDFVQSRCGVPGAL